MRWADLHNHSKLCGHAAGELEETVQSAIKKGLAILGLSEHYPLGHFPDHLQIPDCAMGETMLPGYVQEVHRLQIAYPQIKILLGTEVDYRPGTESILRESLTQVPWDYIMGSVHFLGDWICDHPGHQARFHTVPIDEIYQEYLDAIAQAARSGLFDFIGHPDLIKKFGHRPLGDIRGLYWEVAGVLAESGVGIECNTAGLRKPVGEIYPHQDFLRACAQRGVGVCLGSDSHHPEEVGYQFPMARDLLLSVGYTHIRWYSQRIPQEIPL